MGAPLISPTVLNPLNPLEDDAFEEAVESLKRAFGGFGHIASRIESALGGRRVHAVTMRRWLIDRTLPPRVAFALVKAATAEGVEVSVTDFHPWLKEYV